MKIGVIGTGLQGKRWISALKKSKETQIVVVADTNIRVAESLAKEINCEALDDWEKVVERNDIEAVIISVPTYLHASISIAAMERGKHVLCEKPLARTVDEAREMLTVARRSNLTLKSGFNYRYHPGIQQARKWLVDGVIGELMFLRCRHGICGRLGFEKEWKANTKLSGGGHMMEQGIHIVDLFRWFAGDFSQVVGCTATWFWDIAPSEDNTFAILITPKKQVAMLHSSLTEWKNLFSFEIFGKDGYARVEGLGGSYGVERAILGKRDFVAPFKEEVIEYRGEDVSLQREWEDFVSSVKQQREPLGSGYDGLEALSIVHAIYESSTSGVSSIDLKLNK